jgi:hypothetical protein
MLLNRLVDPGVRNFSDQVLLLYIILLYTAATVAYVTMYIKYSYTVETASVFPACIKVLTRGDEEQLRK